MKEVFGVCKLCEKEKKLSESHIIPKFVFRWLKRTGGKFIRKADNPNKREEDGIKYYLLCNDCEQLFSKLEDKFARDIFYPYSDKKIDTFVYDSDLLKFSISVLYRILLINLNESTTFNELHSRELKQACDEWNKFLFYNKEIKIFNKIYIFFTSDTLNKKILPIERFLNYYARGIDGTIASSNKSCIVYAKMARIILIGAIKGFDDSEMKNTLINSSGGELKVKDMRLNHEIKDFLIYRTRIINNAYDRVSEKQKNIAIDFSSKYFKNYSYSDISSIIENENNMKVDNNLIDFE